MSPISITLDDEERGFFACALRQWGGPARPTDALASAMGFRDVPCLLTDAARLALAVSDGEALAAPEWERALLAAEIVFACDRMGVGAEWEIVSGLPDARAIQLLRTIQRKVSRALAYSQGGSTST